MGVFSKSSCSKLKTSKTVKIALPFGILYVSGQVSLTATVTCNQYYLLSCGADGAR